MLDPAIECFLAARKAAWLDKPNRRNSTGEEKAELERKANHMFALAAWLPSAAQRAKQLYLSSHPAKFSHPDVKKGAGSIIAPTDNWRADGFLRTGNVVAELDVTGNAAALDVYAFLNIKLADNRTILSHLEQKTPTIEEQLTIPDLKFAEVEEGLLAIRNFGDTPTDERIRQVYFPINGDGYHLLSILAPSNLMFTLKERINHMRFSDDAKAAREARKNNKYHQYGYSEVFNLGVIGFGGTKPQNISRLNSQHGGKSYLLLSVPPTLESRSIQPPRADFFSDTLWANAYQDDFQELHNLLGGDRNNVQIRNKRDWIVNNIIDQIVGRVWMVRRLDAGWSDSKNYEYLPHYQKILLDQKYVDIRTDESEWLQPVKKDLARWFLNAFQKLVTEIDSGDYEFSYFESIIDAFEESLR